MPATEEALRKFVSELIQVRRSNGQNLAYNTMKRLILEHFSEDLFSRCKNKVQDMLVFTEQRRASLSQSPVQRGGTNLASSVGGSSSSSLADGGGGGGSTSSGAAGGASGAGEEGSAPAVEETEENLMRVVNEFIVVKKSQNQNISYPTIKRHILKHFSPDFFALHKVQVQERLETAFRRDPSNGQFVEDMQRNQQADAAVIRTRKMDSIFANMEVVLADMKMSHPYPVTDRCVVSQLHCAAMVMCCWVSLCGPLAPPFPSPASPPFLLLLLFLLILLVLHLLAGCV